MKDLHSGSKLYRFLKHQRGAVAIEFVFMLILLVFILAFMVDLTLMRSTMGKLDNTSYSLANLLRERTQLYTGNEELDLTKVNNRDVDNFKKLAALMIYGDTKRTNSISIVLESLSFKKEKNSERAMAIHRKVGDGAFCKSVNNLSELEFLSPRSEQQNGRKIPIYQVTICISSYSLFKAIVLGEKEKSGDKLRSSSITVSR